MIQNNFYTTSTAQFSNEQLAEAVRRMENATIGIKRDLVIMASIALALGKSDPEIVEDTERFHLAMDSISQAICFNVMSKGFKVKDLN